MIEVEVRGIGLNVCVTVLGVDVVVVWNKGGNVILGGVERSGVEIVGEIGYGGWVEFGCVFIY
ncbi:hypothetical protein, partial [Paenibacillus xylanexedens]|uniref:hypothetical protein n=1 Tax=Paenibacillus xylanexedens TaxID=528191 RepID=UPI001C9300F6